MSSPLDQQLIRFLAKQSTQWHPSTVWLGDNKGAFDSGAMSSGSETSLNEEFPTQHEGHYYH